MLENVLFRDKRTSHFAEPKKLSSLTPIECMDLAANAAWLGRGFVSPNPPVGVVLVTADQRFLAYGCHRNYGGDHAEVDAFKRLDEEQRKLLGGATLYTTLEPCSHHGKTPPCADMLARYPLARVVYAHLDPNPLVSGRGIKILEEAGIRCEMPHDFAAKCHLLLDQFCHKHTKKRLYVGLKVATSLNGIAAHRGDKRRWITGERARQFGHWLRMEYDAILVGATTMIRDNPQLNVRRNDLARRRTPLRIVLDPRGRALKDRPLKQYAAVESEPQKTVWVLSRELANSQQVKDELSKHKLSFLALPPTNDASRPYTATQIVDTLADLEITSVLIEGGPATWQTFLGEGLVDHLHAFYAPRLLPTENALKWAGEQTGLNPIILDRVALTPLEEDFLVEGVPQKLD